MHICTYSYSQVLGTQSRLHLLDSVLFVMLSFTFTFSFLLLYVIYSVQANDTYLQMAIGNAPWPIGVTMVGIHARTGREKIFAKSIAHVLNDETQRKYIQVCQSLLCCMCQAVLHYT